MIILAVIILALTIINSLPKNNPPQNGTMEEFSKCLGSKAILYTQLGCHACEIQEQMFGDNYQYLNVVDCFYEQERCSEITHTPTWEINGNKIRAVQSIKTLKELSGC